MLIRRFFLACSLCLFMTQSVPAAADDELSGALSNDGKGAPEQSQSVLTGNGYELSRITISGGGGSVSGSGRELRMTIGQTMAGTSRGEGYFLQVGFWTGNDINSLFKDGFEGTD